MEWALRRIHDAAVKAGITVDMVVFGGAAMILCFGMDRLSRDVDVIVPDAAHSKLVMDAAARIARDREWPENWLNDGVKGFIEDVQEMRQHPLLPNPDAGGVRLHFPSPEYMLALKCMSMRLDGKSHDKDDVAHLVNALGVSDAEQVLDIVERFAPRGNIPPKSEYGVRQLIQQGAGHVGEDDDETFPTP